MEDAESRFAPGDIVRHAEMPQALVVHSVAEGQVVCIWFDERGRSRRARFDPVELEHAEGP